MVLTVKMALIVAVGVFLASFMDAIAGGGGIISVPTYLLAGVPMHMALGTNKVSSGIGTAVSTARFIKNGYIDTFIDAGCVVSTPTCGPCLGGHMGILAAGERCVATTNRNFVGRMGHVKSEVYLASPAVAAASAVTGKISGPDEL